MRCATGVAGGRMRRPPGAQGRAAGNGFCPRAGSRPRTAGAESRRRRAGRTSDRPPAMATQSYSSQSYSAPTPAPPVTPTSRLGGRSADLALLGLRVVGGLMFAQHGAQKLLGWFANPQAARALPAPGSLSWIAGVLELVGGPLIALGLFTRPVAFLLAGTMAVAYFKAHAPDGFWPIVNRGELAVLYCFVFLLLAAAGPGAYSLDAALRSRGRTRG